MSMCLYGVAHIRTSVRCQNTRLLLITIAQAINERDGKNLLSPVPAFPGAIQATIATIDVAKYPISPCYLDASGNLVDDWRRPIHVTFIAQGLDSRNYGAWSDGPNRLDDAAMKDDIASWR